MRDTLPLPLPDSPAGEPVRQPRRPAVAGADAIARRTPAMLLVRIRWWMLGGLLLVGVASAVLLGIGLPAAPLAVLLVLSAAWNGGQALAGCGHADPTAAGGGLLRTLLIDTLLLSGLLFFSGGATNPLVFLLLLPVAAGALLLSFREAGLLALAAAAAYLVLLQAHIPLQLPDPAQAATLHLAGMAVTFVASAAMLVVLISQVRENLRRREADLRAAREQALRDRQLLALGTLAAGAAHELGTPLATMRLVADELAAGLAGAADGGACPGLAEDIAVLREQIDYCKTVVTNLTERAGVGRCDQAAVVAADEWVRRTLDGWGRARPGATVPALVVAAGMPVPRLVADPGLAQVLHALLDNARRIDPRPEVRLDAAGDRVRIAVLDRGPGFPPALLAAAGEAPLGAHAGGEGLGLLLARRHLTYLGGRLTIANRTGGGAAVALDLPVVAVPGAS